MLPAPADVYDVPIYANCRVHRDNHIEIAKALYSVPGNLLGARVQVRADRRVVRIFHRSKLVKVHPRRLSNSEAAAGPTLCDSCGGASSWCYDPVSRVAARSPGSDVRTSIRSPVEELPAGTAGRARPISLAPQRRGKHPETPGPRRGVSWASHHEEVPP
jgi:hypothetical protein